MIPTAVADAAGGARGAGARVRRRRSVQARAARRQHARQGRVLGGRADRGASRAGRRDDHDADLVGPVRRRRPLPRAPDRGLSHQADQRGRAARRPIRRVLHTAPAPASDGGRRRHRPRTRRRRPAFTSCSRRTTSSTRCVAVKLLTRRGHTVTVANNGPRGARRAGARTVRSRPDGRADAGDGRPRGHRGDPAARAEHRRAHAHRRDDRARDDRRSRALLAAGMDGYLSKPLDPRACCLRPSSRRAAAAAARSDTRGDRITGKDRFESGRQHTACEISRKTPS